MEYSITPTPQAGPMVYRLDGEQLHVRWEKTGREASMPYAAIQIIEVRRPMPRLMTTRVRSATGSIVIESLEVKVGRKRQHTRAYATFVRALFDELARRGMNVPVVVGSSTVWGIGLAIGAFTTLLAVLMLVGLLFGGVVLAPAFLGFPLVYFLAWTLMRSGTTRTVAYADISEYCLPSVDAAR
jgi:hypothetical protein